MFKAIIDFFLRLFGGKKKTTEQPPVDVTTPLDADGPQDGADVPGDSLEVPQPPVVPGDIPAEITETDPVSPVVEPETAHVPKYLWCLDNGHGKATPGKRSPLFEDGERILEYELVRDINKRIMAALDAKGVRYYNVTPEVEGDIKLSERVSRANGKASDLPKIFVSIHANANGNGDWNAAEGLETWYHETSTKGRHIASAFQAHLVKKLGWKDRGIRFHIPGDRAFYVLRKTSMPAVLTENGFYTNRNEAEEMRKDSVRQAIAQAHVDAILEIEKNEITGVPVYSKNIGIKLS